MCLLLSGGIIPVRAQDASLGGFEAHGDVGSPALTGSASYDAASQEYTLSGAGTNMWFATDQFHFLWRKMKGDFILRARVEFAGAGANAHRKIGWMARPSLETGSPYVDAVEHGNGLTSMQFRRAVGSNTEQLSFTISNADVLQLERKGKSFVFSAARYGEPFVSRELTNIDLDEEVYAGLFICSHNGGTSETARFRDVRLIRPAPDGFVPYHDYIGSALEILEVQTGELEQIYNSTEPFEAPNWTPDAQALIYNISGRGDNSGRLCRFDLATGARQLLDTGACVKNNNDHVLSCDGRTLGLSDQSADHGGQSCIFTVSIDGGIPVTITPLMPSYLHGWSPDGKFLVYTGGRNGKFDIYKIPAGGSVKETRLTDSPGLNDGPEYTPDGNRIYFNSSRGGTMQIWRMKPGRPGPGTSDPRRIQQLVSPRFSGRQMDCVSFLRPGGRSQGPSLLQASLPAPAADWRRPAEDNRLCLRRAGHDQRPILVTRQHPNRLRQQLPINRLLRRALARRGSAGQEERPDHFIPSSILSAD